MAYSAFRCANCDNWERKDGFCSLLLKHTDADHGAECSVHSLHSHQQADRESTLPAAPKAIEIRIGNVDLTAKLSAIGAALEAVRLAHRDEVGARCWQAMQKAEAAIGEAILYRSDRCLAGTLTEVRAP
jgi:hypothetical protein